MRLIAAILVGVLAADAAAQLPVAPAPSNPGKVRGTLADGTVVMIDPAVWASAPLADAPAPAAQVVPQYAPATFRPVQFAPPVVLSGGCANGRCGR